MRRRQLKSWRCSYVRNPPTACSPLPLDHPAAPSPSRPSHGNRCESRRGGSDREISAQVVFVAGRGCKLYNIDGREYLDMAAGIAVNSLGHCDPDLVDAATDQAKRLGHASNVGYTVPQVELAKRIVESSFADRVFFANSGTEANEAAIKFSRKYQRVAHPDGGAPTEFVSFSNCFHGRTMGSLALTSKNSGVLSTFGFIAMVTSIAGTYQITWRQPGRPDQRRPGRRRKRSSLRC